MINIFKKVRFFLRLVTAFWQVHKKTMVIAFGLGIVIAASFPKLVGFFYRRKPQRIGFVGKYTIETLPGEVLGRISYGLTSVDKSGAVNPAVASSWRLVSQEKAYRFTLKDNLFWHDGTPVKATDISYNFSDVSVEKKDEKTIEFQLKEPFSPFPSVVSRPLFKKGLIGVGDYKVKSIERNGQIIEKLVLEPHLNSGKTIVYKFYPTQAMIVTAFKLGEIDIIRDISDLGSLEGWPNIEAEEKTEKSQFASIIFNTQEGIFSEKSTRQALAYATSKEWPNRALGPISPDSWAYNANLKEYEFDLEKALELLKKGLGEEADEEIVLTVFPHLFSLAEKIADDWGQLDLTVKIEVTDIVPDSFQALLVVEDIPPDPDQYLLWHSTQPGNLSRFRSPQIDKLLEDGRKIMDPDERREIYLDFQRFLVEDAPIIFLYHPTVYTVRRK